MFAPVKLGEGGRKHPVILWGNGTNTPIVAYAPMLRDWASHGFVVAAAKSGQAGSGAALIGCLDRLAAKNAAPGSFYYGRLDLSRVGASGHSQGGSGAIAAAAKDARITALVPIQPGRAAVPVTAPMLLLSGSADMTTPPATAQAPIFAGARGPVVWATLKGASHTSPIRGGAKAFGGAAAAFFRWRLMSEADGAAFFDGARAADWTVQRR